MPPVRVHFNGSVNLPDAETVMREISSRVPVGVSRMTDGETGERRLWVRFQRAKFEAMPEFVPAGPNGAGYRSRQLRLAEGASPQDIAWPDPGYADVYGLSFRVFRALQDGGTIPAGVRFQLQYPTPLAVLAGGFVTEDRDRIGPSYEACLFADLDRALAALPHERVAVQWDVAVEFGMLEGVVSDESLGLDTVVSDLARCADRVPGDVPVGMHLCYGDGGHRHFIEPESLALQVRVANAVAERAGRGIGWFSFTVPQQRRDSAYFAPLADLEVDRTTELYFGVVPYHPDEQPAGTTAAQISQIDAHLAESKAGPRDWGISTECGMGRVEQQDVPRLLDLYREILGDHG